ncbi:MAG: glycerophosphodiester phosphodiesterase [Kaiparowitsia implicata GSE-PSE-MK54-09C]|jgi:glycerophosphoryl diester phosphodiesterase|nr:glycerophosphodiester phosphodiesterase [Kaiparowitsia implicata GSE-PSE-MK54-09C]
MQPQIIAHRGASAYEKENTLAAFEKAIALGADMIEFDVRRTKDKRLIIYHDPTLKDRPIRKLTLDDVRTVDADVLTLEEALELCIGRIRLDVELKGMGFEKEIVRLLLASGSPQQFVVTSFYPAAIQRIKKKCPDIMTGFLFGDVTVDVCKSLRCSANSVRKRVRKMKADFIAPDWQLLDSKLLSKVVGELPIWLWTVNDADVMHQAMGDPRIEGIITDKPDLGMEIRQQWG